MATVATERKNGNGTTARHNGTAKRQNGNGMVETRHDRHSCVLSAATSIGNEHSRQADILIVGVHYNFDHISPLHAQTLAEGF